MLDTHFSRPAGDAGNPASWPFPVRIERVDGAHARPIVEGRGTDVGAFVAAGLRLAQKGVCAITTTCGFLVRHQIALAAALPVPILTSTLTQYARLTRQLQPGKRMAIMTIAPESLDPAVLASAGIESSALVFGLPPDAHFVRAILDGAPELDVHVASREWVALALASRSKHPEIGGWLFECANMPPYSHAVAEATRLPVYDALTLGVELHAQHSRVKT